jgi:acyl-CoA synthetase (AMP-forming)/AMP-acid ligase II
MVIRPDEHGAHLARLIREEGVTLAAGVPTVWQGLLDHLDAEGGDMSSLQRVLVGGSTCPESLIQRMEHRFQARVQTRGHDRAFAAGDDRTG